MEQEMSLEQLEKLEKNPHYKLSKKQQALLDKHRAGKAIKHNPTFTRHQTTLEEEPNNGKATDSN